MKASHSHTLVWTLAKKSLAMGINRSGLSLATPGHRPVHCMVMIITPTSLSERHLEDLQTLAASIGRDRSIQQQLYHIESPAHADGLLHLDQQFEDWNYYLEDVEQSGPTVNLEVANRCSTTRP